MRRDHPYFGLTLAAFGALVITPDTLFMRMTGMTGTEMLAWRGLMSGGIFVIAWVLTRRADLGQDIRMLLSPLGLGIVLSHTVNAVLFSLGIANAPVSVVLFAVATMPVFAAVFAHLFAGERTGRATWIATAAVLGGIGLAVFGADSRGVGLNHASLLGAAAGLGVAAAMATTFVALRHVPQLPLLAVMGTGSLIAGAGAAAVAGTAGMMSGSIPAVLASALFVLPLSFAALSFATRHTAAVNVGLLMLLETILGPVWVWIGVGEAMNPWQIVGGVIVVASLAIYIPVAARSRPTPLPDPA